MTLPSFKVTTSKAGGTADAGDSACTSPVKEAINITPMNMAIRFRIHFSIGVLRYSLYEHRDRATVREDHTRMRMLSKEIATSKTTTPLRAVLCLQQLRYWRSDEGI